MVSIPAVLLGLALEQTLVGSDGEAFISMDGSSEIGPVKAEDAILATRSIYACGCPPMVVQGASGRRSSPCGLTQVGGP
jgi:hypothetical protein